MPAGVGGSVASTDTHQSPGAVRMVCEVMSNEEARVLDPVMPSGHPRGRDLASFRAELERCWCAETSFWPREWTSARPSVGQCAVTALVVHDRFGGEIYRTINQGLMHYWNRVDGVEVDLTRDQFEVWAPEEAVVTVDRDELAGSGPTLAVRHRRLAGLLSAGS